jgi:hypothetical protein
MVHLGTDARPEFLPQLQGEERELHNRRGTWVATFGTMELFEID